MFVIWGERTTTAGGTCGGTQRCLMSEARHSHRLLTFTHSKIARPSIRRTTGTATSPLAKVVGVLFLGSGIAFALLYPRFGKSSGEDAAVGDTGGTRGSSWSNLAKVRDAGKQKE